MIISLAPIALGPEVPLPASGLVEVIVLIDAEGRARLDDPLEPGPLRDAIAHALSQSEFRPAQSNGTAVAARVTMTLRLVASGPSATTPESAAAAPSEDGSVLAPAAAAAAAAAEPESYGARGRVAALPPTGRRLELREMRDLPGAFGDPFRVLDALPGVVPALSGLPYVYVRGAPPAGTVYYFDGIQVPALFHLALGPAVVHPALIGGVDFFASVAPARFGRYTGGVLTGNATRPTLSRANAELELRLIDAMGRVEVPVGGGSLLVAGRYGYPGPILSLLSPDAVLAYWDYQTRLSLPVGAHDRFELLWLGSFDRAGSRDFRDRESTVTLEFHRMEARLLREVGPLELGAALQLGYERSAIDSGLQVESARIGPRVFAQWRAQNGLRLRVGGDLFGTVGELRAPSNQDGAQVEIRVPAYADVAARSTSGAYAELSAPLGERWTLDLGLRADLWLTGSRSQIATDPRAMLTWRASEWLEWHVAAGLGHQPAVFLIPLPGIADVGLEHGLQESIQSEFGVAFNLPWHMRLESQIYAQRLSNVILPDLALEQSDDCDQLPPSVAELTPECNEGYPRSSVWAYGWEVFLRRDPSEQLSGWISYTLGWADAHADAGFDFTPSYDVRHVLNAVLQYRIGTHWQMGARLHYRTGKIASVSLLREAPFRYQQRLPGFFRGDVQLSYAWQPSWGRMRVSLEWFNITLSREATDIECRDDFLSQPDPLASTPCKIRRAPALFFPNLGVRAEF